LKALKDYFFLVSGTVMVSLGVDLFLLPNSVVTGGASGAGIVLYEVFSVPLSLTVAVINIFLFAIAYKILGKAALLKTTLSIFMLSLFLQIFSGLGAISDDIFLASVFGGVVVGLGTGLVIIGGASTGGSDFAAILLHKIFSHTSVANLIFIIDFVIVLASGLIFKDYTLLLYGFIRLFTTSKTVDFVLKGTDFARLIFIITGETDDISTYIINVLNRGVTFLEGRGAYSGTQRQVMLCAVSPAQFPKLKTYVLSKDKNAFIILTDARGVFGKGFNIE